MNECVECGKPTRNKYCANWKCRWPNRTYLEHRTRQHIILVMKIRKSPTETHLALAKRLGVSRVTVATIRRRELEEPRRKQRWIKLTHDGQTRTVPEWAKITGLSAKIINQRRRFGWSVERILETPKIVPRRSRKRREEASKLFHKHERARLCALIAQHPEMTNEALGKLVGRSESAVSRIRKSLGNPKRKSGRPLPRF